ncbi:FecR domain-containing protein [Luteolibacter arcticus]|uniref:FecR domain-containing protein n=1 Tax=Luteolibacter arcticus TaxID=1581411 RepID=A0ABT3GM35_9BACT|nr:TonB-dependent receptor [Luteolibacter arcticus]MCW1924545.1 FecR domain-containing protein [Luteolibacter arcticus]
MAFPLPRALWLVAISVATAAAEPSKEGGKIVATENEVDRSAAPAKWVKAAIGDGMKWQEQVRTGELSRAAIELSTGGVLRMSELTSLRLQPPSTGQADGRSKIDFGKGVVYFFSRSDAESDIKTPTASLNIRGTEFVLEATGGKTVVTMIDGAVTLSNPIGAIDLASGEQGIAEPGKVPRKTAVLDASEDIQWFLYYPGIANPAGFPGLGGNFAASRKAYAEGDLLRALELLPAARTAEEHRYSAAVKLASGRIDEVEEDLRQAGDGPLTESLRLLIDVVKRPAAEMAHVNAPATLEGRMALSYALQSRGELEGSLAAAKEAVTMSPDFGLGWARVAELEFSFGRTKEAIAAVEKALAISPRNAQAISLKAYLEMSRNRIPEARQLFAQAIAIDPALGNAWLGQGLAHFQMRNREQGVRSITIAAAVEPNRSFLRSYLGKAFAETRRDARAGHELGLAMKLDPGDPTPPFYRALLDQRDNAYNKGIADLEESIELNDNRSIYRSGFLLDKDRSVRESNLAAFYHNVGMTEVSLEEARRSVVSDYLNPSAHLFLSNSAAALRDPRRVSLRQETPWFNELLMANIISPAGTALLPQNISQQEYTELFDTRPFGFTNRTNYRGDGEFLSTGTAMMRFDRTSIALDYDIFNADGDRPNQDVERSTAYLQLRHALTPQDSIYLHLKFQDFEGGDLRQLYDPTTYDPDFRVEQEQSPVTMVSYQHEWSPESRTLMLGGALTDRIRSRNAGATSFAMLIDRANPGLSTPLSFTSDITQERETEVYFGEVQHIWSTEHQTLLFGTRFESGSFPTTNTLSKQSISGILPDDPFVLSADPDYERWVAYIYYTRELVKGLWATGGLAYDWQEYPFNSSLPPVSNAREESSALLPKAGLVWTPSHELTMRLGYARSQGGSTFDESVRLEPTQVAGFTQSFRTLINESVVGGVPGLLFDIGGASVLYKFPTRTYLGGEAFVRTAAADRGVGVLAVDSSTFTYYDTVQIAEDLDYQEWGGTAYVNQLLGEEWALGARYSYTSADLDRSFPELTASGVPGFSSAESSDLHQAEAYLIWNHASGWFSRLNARFFSQDNSGYTPTRPGDSWTQLDFSLGKRFLDNRGSLEAGVLNLTGEDYRFNPLLTLPDFPRDRTFFVEMRFDL